MSTDSKEKAMAFMRSVAQRSGDPFYVANPADDFRFVYVNDAACDHFGRSREEMLALSLYDVDPFFPARRWPSFWEELKEQGAMFFETVHRHADGREIPVAVSANLFAQEGRELFGGCIHDLREQRRSEEALKESEERLRVIFNSTYDGILVHTPDGELLDANESFLRMHGLNREQALGLHIEDLSSPSMPMETARAIWAKALAGEPQLFEWKGRRYKDRAEFDAEVFLRKVRLEGRDVILANVRDITARKQVEEALRQSEECFRLVFNQQFQFMAVLSPEGIVLQINDLPLHVQGYGREDYIGKPFWESPAWRTLPEWKQIWPARLAQAAQMDGPLLTEDIFLAADGSTHSADAATTAVHDEEGRTKFFIVQAIDTTERKRAEEALIDARKTAEAASRAKDHFLANMSHELRTPMTVIMSALEFLLESKPAPEQLRLMEMAEASAHRLLEIIEDLLDISRIETGRLLIKELPFDLRKTVQEAVGTFSVPAQRKGILLAWDVDRQVPERVAGDPERVRQVLVNLIGNAVKFTEHGRIIVTATAVKEQLVFTVSDTGIGIDAARLGEIFEPFTQVDTSSTRRFGGTGLGLTICRELVELMGGGIRATSELGRGSVFSFTLPLKEAGARKEEQETGTVEVKEERGERTGRILLVEDEPDVREMIRLILEQGGWTAELAASGEEAVAKWKAGAFDLILMDVQMPGMDGLDATRLIRKMEGAAREHTCIVALTAHAGKETKEECLAAGMDLFLPKPVKIAELYEAIDSCLGRK